ncbi:MAG: phosphate signaling complex protein PhoU [Elusimicrobiota bacterium]|jgi:phosphate transport system protein|nr:phosphate signaling complex protein PhoU [Elusimicrobiota bacterium]
MINENIIELKKEAVEYAKHIESMIISSTRGVFERDNSLLEKTLKIDEIKSDQMEISLYENCINAIAKFQPMAKNLRIIIGLIKMSGNLERIGDHCVNIAESGLILNTALPVKSYIDLPKMNTLAIDMLREAIFAFVNQDKTLAESILNLDDEIDGYKGKIIRELEDYMTDQKTAYLIVELMNIVSNLERIADLTVNICEEVIYIESGKLMKEVDRSLSV